MIKRIFAIIGLVLIFAWVLATAVVAFLPFPGKSLVFGILAAGCVILPIMLWIILWIISTVTGKDNIATFRSKEMNETMNQAEIIKHNMKEANKEQSAKE